MKNWSNLILALILVSAFALRTINLDKVPSSLFGDEVDVGYQAYSILKTGQDLYGQNWPVLIHSLSEYRAPLFIYSAVPFVAIFGLNEWGVRLPAVFWGILGIFGVYLLTKKLFNEKIALFTAMTLAISPWHIQYSRAAFEVTMLLAFEVFAVYFFLLGLNQKKWFLAVSALLFALTPYIYSTAVVFTPLIILILGLIHFSEFKKSMMPLILAGLVFILILTPYGVQTISGKAGARFNVISIFSNQELKDKVLLAQQTGQLSPGLERIFHNQPLIYLQFFSLNYLRALSPEFLFLNGDPNFRQSIHEMGQMYFYEIILLLFGVWLLLKDKLKNKFLLFGWLLIAPIPAALTYDGGYHATRNFLMIVPLSILVGLGLNSLLENSRKPFYRYIFYGLVILVVFNFTFFLNRYFIEYPVESWRAWHFGFKESMQYVKDNQSSYERVLVNNTYEPALGRFLFWMEYDPIRFHHNFTVDKPVENITLGFNGFSLENKYFFGKSTEQFEKVNSKTLIVASARDDITNPETLKDANVRLLKTVLSPTKEPIFYIFTGNK